MRRDLEEGFGIDATDIYGLSEVMGPGVAQECVETKDGLTVWEDHFYPEIVDPKTLQPVPDGEVGELVITPLTKEAFPIIRYRTRDLTRLLPGTARSMRRIDRISARNDDMNPRSPQHETSLAKRSRPASEFPSRSTFVTTLIAAKEKLNASSTIAKSKVQFYRA